MFDLLDAIRALAFSAGIECVPVTILRDAHEWDSCIQGKDYPPFVTRLR